MTVQERDRPLVLVVEDDPDAARIAQDMLESLGCHAAIASNAMEGLFIVNEGRPDLVLLDISLPDMNGVAFLDAARSMPEARDVPVIVASAIYKSDSHMTRSLRERGAFRYLEKPFSRSQLQKALAQVLPGWTASTPVHTDDPAAESYSEGSTLELDVNDLGIESLTGIRAIADDDIEDEEIVIEDRDLDDNIGELIGPLHASVVRDDGRVDVEVVGLREDAVTIQTGQLQPRPGDLIRLELRARKVGFDQEIHHVSVLLLTRAGSVQRRGVAWEVGLLVEMARPDDLWPSIGEVWRPDS